MNAPQADWLLSRTRDLEAELALAHRAIERANSTVATYRQRCEQAMTERDKLAAENRRLLLVERGHERLLDRCDGTGHIDCPGCERCDAGERAAMRGDELYASEKDERV